jgi:hypothetical protein
MAFTPGSKRGQMDGPPSTSPQGEWEDSAGRCPIGGWSPSAMARPSEASAAPSDASAKMMKTR